jgi:gamma-glutamyltranspeptidase / glutathione hydrolase
MSSFITGTPGRPGTAMATRGLVSSGHQLSSAAGAFILEKGGNAVDAGVAAGLVLNVVHSDMNSFGGVAPIILYDNERDEVITYRGVGWWPEVMTPTYFNEHHNGDIPRDSAISCVVTSAPDAWLHALKNHGTMTFEEVSASARDYARNGFVVSQFMHDTILHMIYKFRSPTTAAIFLPDNGNPPPVGDIMIQSDLADLFDELCSVERDYASSGREAAIQAIRDHFYRGPIAEKMVEYSSQHGGRFSLADFAEFEADRYPSVSVDFGRYTVHGCGPWSQGPVVGLALNILRNFDLESMGHNSAEYLHTVIGALDLAFSARHHFMGDPAHVAVPIQGLTSDEFGRESAARIKPGEAFLEMPHPGDPWKYQPDGIAWPDVPLSERTVYQNVPVPSPTNQEGRDNDTSYVCAADRFGNFFSATPSDGAGSPCPVIPGLGISISERGEQAWTDPANPNAAGPRKRPRLTPNPGLIFRDGKPWAAFGTPGNDRQPQAMLQVFLNIAVFGMAAQEAVQAPRIATYNMPATAHPHEYEPGVVRIESRISEEVRNQLRAWGHRVEDWPDYMPTAGAPCIVIRDPETGIFYGGADHRRQSQAIGI